MTELWRTCEMKEGVCPSILLHWRRWLSAKKVHSQVSHPPSTSSILSLLGAQASGGTRRQGERVLCEATVGNPPQIHHFCPGDLPGED